MYQELRVPGTGSRHRTVVMYSSTLYEVLSKLVSCSTLLLVYWSILFVPFMHTRTMAPPTIPVPLLFHWWIGPKRKSSIVVFHAWYEVQYSYLVLGVVLKIVLLVRVLQYSVLLYWNVVYDIPVLHRVQVLIYSYYYTSFSYFSGFGRAPLHAVGSKTTREYLR
jgi:hypothetical protein